MTPSNPKDENRIEAVLIGPARQPTTDPYNLGQLFLEWAWGTTPMSRDWNAATRVLARALRGLSEAGLIERRTVRRNTGETHHGFVLTEDGHEALRALAGDWIEDAR